MKAMICALAITTLFSWAAYAQEDTMKVKITINKGTVITATMEDNPTTRDFMSLLPLTLSLEDYSKTEKISDLPKRLTKKGAPAAITPKVGDITLYAPWGNLAIFYRDGHHSPGLIKLGEINSGVEAFNVSGPLNVTIETVK